MDNVTMDNVTDQIQVSLLNRAVNRVDRLDNVTVRSRLVSYIEQ